MPLRGASAANYAARPECGFAGGKDASCFCSRSKSHGGGKHGASVAADEACGGSGAAGDGQAEQQFGDVGRRGGGV
jgi:hypothetical protein